MTDKERPNYRLEYKVVARDDYDNEKYNFNADNNEAARKIALEFIQRMNAQDEELIRTEKKSWYDRLTWKPLALVRIEYTIEQIVRETCFEVPLHNPTGHLLNRA